MTIRISKLIYIHFPLNPVPASRPRVSRWGTYYPKRHETFRREASGFLDGLEETGVLPDPPLEGGLVVWVTFNIKKPKTTKLDLPRGDVDNYTKILFDALTGRVWKDDTQVEIMSVRKAWAEGEGSIDIWIKEHD